MRADVSYSLPRRRMVAPDPDPRDAEVDPPGIGLTVPGGRGWRVGRRRAHSLRWAGRIRYSLVRWCFFFFTIRRPPGTTLTENDVDLAVSGSYIYYWIRKRGQERFRLGPWI